MRGLHISHLCVGAVLFLLALIGVAQAQELPPQHLGGHSGAVLTLSFNSDGTLLASAGDDGRLKLWRLTDGKQVWSVAGDRMDLRRGAFSPDGKLLASSGLYTSIMLRQPATGECLREIRVDEPGAIDAVAFSPDGSRLVLTDCTGVIRILDLATGTVVRRLKGHRGGATMLVAFSPDGKTLASTSHDGAIKLWDAETGKELRPMSPLTRQAAGLAFHPQGKWLATCSEDPTDFIQLWKIETGRRARAFGGPSTAGGCLAFRPDGRVLAACGSDGRLTLWNPETGARLGDLGGATAGLTGLAYSRDGKRLAAGDSNGRLLLWTLPEPEAAGVPLPEQANPPPKPSLDVPGLRFQLVNAQGREEYLHEKSGAVLVLLPAGEFDMGSPDGESGRSPDERRHRVHLSRPFLLGKTEVTNAQYLGFVRRHSSGHYGKEDLDEADRPVVQVSCDDAEAFCTWAGLRLPTEAEWQFAARGGQDLVFPWGNQWPPPAGAANLADAALHRVLPDSPWVEGLDDGCVATAPIGRFAPNPFGLHDLAGNVSEWCADEYGEYPRGEPAIDPVGPGSGEARLVLGSSWGTADRGGVRCAVRAKCPTDTRNPFVGFRVALSTAPLADAGEKRHKPRRLSTEDRKAFAWWDGAGDFDVTQCKLIRLTRPERAWSPDEGRQSEELPAFLLEEKGTSFTVYTFEETKETLERTDPKAPPDRLVRFEESDLEREVREFLPPEDEGAEKASDTGPGEKDPDAKERPFSIVEYRRGIMRSHRAVAFLLGRACAARGLPDLAARLCEHARTLSVLWRGKQDRVALLAYLQETFGQQRLRDAVNAFADPAVPRTELLDRLRWIVRDFPESGCVGEAQGHAVVLERMVAEDERHAREVRKPLVEMSPQERVAELIFQLRDQRGWGYSEPAEPGAAREPRPDKSPVGQLVRLGYGAVPQLLLAMEDERFTRTLASGGLLRPCSFVRVGAFAQHVLERIAGEALYDMKILDAAFALDPKEPLERRLIKAWWAGVQKAGGVEAYQKEVEEVRLRAEEERRVRASEPPEAAVRRIAAGLDQVKEMWDRASLIRELGAVRGKAPLALLKAEARNGATRILRVQAAWGLAEHRDFEVLPAMIAEWRGLAPREVGILDGWTPDRADPGNDELLRYLIYCPHPDAIQVIAGDFGKMPARLCERVLDIVREMHGIRDQNPPLDVAAGEEPASAFPEKKAWEDALEGFLVEVLEDTERKTDIHRSEQWIGGSFDGVPRICDLAGRALKEYWPARYAFDINAPMAAREQWRRETCNARRGRLGLPSLGTAAGPPAEPAAEEQVRPLLNALAEGSTDAARSAAASDLEGLGLGAWPAARKLLLELPADHAARARLEALVLSLGNCVHTVEMAAGSRPAEGRLLELLKGLRGKPLTFERLASVFRDGLRVLPAGACTLELFALRAAGHPGVLLVVRIGEDRPAYGEESGRWGTGVDLFDVQEVSPASFGYWLDFGGPVEMEGRRLDTNHLEGRVRYLTDQALRLPIDRPYGLRIRVTRRP